MSSGVRGNDCIVFISVAGGARAAVFGAMLKFVVDGGADLLDVLW